MARWIHPMSDKWEVGDVQSSCETQLLAAHHVTLLHPGAEEPSEKVMMSKELFVQPLVWIVVHHSELRYCRVLTQQVHVLEAAFGSCSDETEGEHVNWIFHFFPNLF